jgi:hypothetical protein
MTRFTSRQNAFFSKKRRIPAKKILQEFGKAFPEDKHGISDILKKYYEVSEMTTAHKLKDNTNIYLGISKYNPVCLCYEKLYCKVISSECLEHDPTMNMLVIVSNLLLYSRLHENLVDIEVDSQGIRGTDTAERTKERLDNLVGMQWYTLCSMSDKDFFKRIQYTDNQDRINKIRKTCLSRIKGVRNALCKMTCIPKEIRLISEIAYPR